MAENASWVGTVTTVQDGDPVAANVVNQPLLDLSERDQYLFDLVTTALLGQQIVARGVTLDASVLVNQPVAYNAGTQQFEPALAVGTVDGGGFYVPGAVADCVGLCIAKSNPTLGDLILGGRYETDLANAVSGTPAAGRYYVSGTTAGKLTQTRPPVSVPVLYWDGAYAYVGPNRTQFVETTPTTVVTSLVGIAPVTVTAVGGGASSVGPLQVGVTLNFAAGGSPVDGWSVFKGITGTTFTQGNVLEGLFAGANVTLTSVAGPVETVSGQPMYQGRTRIDVAIDLSERELLPQITKLNDAFERNYNGIMYLGLAAGRVSGIVMQLRVPYAGLPATPTVVIRMTLLATAGGTLPATTLQFVTLPRPVGSGSVALPGSPTVVACDTNVACAASQYVEVNSSPIAVNPGDTLFVTLIRSASDGYTGELGIIRPGGVIVAG
jgi:hypothetical protein